MQIYINASQILLFFSTRSLFVGWSHKLKVQRANWQTLSLYLVRFSTDAINNNIFFLLFHFGFFCFSISFSLLCFALLCFALLCVCVCVCVCVWLWFVWIVSTSLTYSWIFHHKLLQNAAFKFTPFLINIIVRSVWYFFRIIFWQATQKCRIAESTTSLNEIALVRARFCT